MKYNIGDIVNYRYMGLIYIYDIDKNDKFQYKVISIYDHDATNQLSAGLDDMMELFCKDSKLSRLVLRYQIPQDKLRSND